MSQAALSGAGTDPTLTSSLPARTFAHAAAEGKFQLKRAEGKPVVVVLGSGWAAHSCIKVIDTDRWVVGCGRCGECGGTGGTAGRQV